ncbi:proline racemase family protein [Aurantimonas endophytica]|uniref:Proline racemase n=1 Tax=Aurantimonas endophytica TaxID=1522175 RepID=A0A7W6HD92_9HYPH|nr:proline racemase family protein [Aurantimonas endophytica]MBB4003089.1 proline racemase [Aurantimonas endophytica]MCO6403961.1 proline racemase [Aurantimonas endophytica]
MRWKKTASMIEVHAEGEVGRVVTSGVLDVPGATMLDKMLHINEVDGSLRRFFCFEPRGYAQMSTNLLFPPTRPDADAAFLILQPDRAHAMSGSNSICVVTALLETGILPIHEPQTVVRLETPAGIVKAVAQCTDGKCVSVSLDMSPSFVDRLDAVVEVEGLGPVTVDIAFGGVFYALIDPAQFGMAIDPAAARTLADIASRVHRAVDAQLDVQHPTTKGLGGISYTMFVDRDARGDLRGATVLPPGRFDRSPCGTGNSARLACMVARGEAAVGDRFEARSIIGSKFDVGIFGETKVGDRPAILPRITGRGWIHGFHQIGLDPSDPFPEGYAVADCWGDGMDLLK